MLKIDRTSTQTRSIIDFARLPIDGIEVAGRYSYISPRPGINPECFTTLIEVIFLERGQQPYVVAGDPVTLNGNEVLIIYPGEEHSTGESLENRGRLYWMILHASPTLNAFGLSGCRGKAIIDRFLDRRLPQRFSASRGVRLSFERLFHYGIGFSDTPDEYDRSWQLIRLQHALIECLINILECREHGLGRYPTGQIKRVVKNIRQDPSRHVSVTDLAKEAGLSVPHFQRRFKDEIGMPPKEYLNRCRIEYAKSLLRDTKLSVTSTAHELGFSSSQYFATVFRKYTGLTPVEFLSAKTMPADHVVPR